MCDQADLVTHLTELCAILPFFRISCAPASSHAGPAALLAECQSILYQHLAPFDPDLRLSEGHRCSGVVRTSTSCQMFTAYCPVRGSTTIYSNARRYPLRYGMLISQGSVCGIESFIRKVSLVMAPALAPFQR